MIERVRSVWPRSLGAAALALLLLAAPAGAELRLPAPTMPARGSSVDALPAFAWKPVVGADHYEFQIGADSSFSSPVLGYDLDRLATMNTRATLNKTVPNGTYWWHVRAVTKTGVVSAWSSPRSIKKAWRAAPILQSPKNGATVRYPMTPLTLAWTPVPHAAKYLVSLATDPDLGSLVGRGAVETAAASFTPPMSLANGTYYWGVTPIDAGGNRGARSRVGSFHWEWPSATTPRITDLADAPEFFDPQFSWDFVPGAARYEVEVNSSQDFAPGSKVCCGSTVTGTSLSPTVIFKDNTYYWRMRAFDVDGNAGAWNTGPSFTKTFDNVPPVSGASIKNFHVRDNLGDPGVSPPGFPTQVPIVTWDPVPGAASYEVEVVPFNSGDCAWNSSSEHWHLTTAAVAWTPLGSRLSATKPYPDQLNVVTDGSTALVANHHYCVRVRARSDRDSSGADVYGDFTYLPDAFTFTGYPTGGSCSPSCTHGYLGSNDYLLPARGVTTSRMPLFTWRAVAGAASYFVIVAKDPSFSNDVDYAFTQAPAYSPRSLHATTYSDETTSYYWVVLPATSLDGRGAVGNPLDGAPADFQKRSVPPTLISPEKGANVTGQPTFHWTPVEGARRYRLQISTDPSFGAPIDDVLSSSTAYTSNSTYPAATALYWRVRADDENLVGLTWSATATFQNRLSAPVPNANLARGDMIPTWTWGPVRGAVSYDVHVELPNGTTRDVPGLRSPAITAVTMTGTGVFHWQVRANFPRSSSGVVPGPYSSRVAFTRTIRAPAGARASVRPRSLLFSWSPKLGAKSYRLQVSTRPDFAQTVENVTTDNTSYAPLLQRQYQDGGALYWRVAAVDADGNSGNFTPTRSLRLGRAGAARK